MKLMKKNCFGKKGHMQSQCRQSSSLPMCLLHVETQAGKGRALILTNDQSEGLHDGATCVPEHSTIASGQCFFSFDGSNTVTVYIFVASSSSPDSLLISLQLLRFVWENVRGKAS